MMSPAMMQMMLALMDMDGDGAISLSEFQAAHERIFKTMEADKDGRLTIREMQVFLQGEGEMGPMTRPARQDRSPQSDNNRPALGDNKPPIRREPPRTDDRPGYDPPAGAQEP
jgi:EF hand